MRHLFALLSALSLALCLATVAFWIRSHMVEDRLEHYRSSRTLPDGTRIDHYLVIKSESGTLDFWTELRFAEARQPHWRWSTWPPSAASSAGWPGIRIPIRCAPASLLPGRKSPGLLMDYWLPALLTSILPLLWLRLHRIRARRRRSARRLCLTCGYDLRASPTRCPECGTPIPEKASAISGPLHRSPLPP